MSLLDALFLGALREALEEQGGGGGSRTTVTRTNRFVFNEKHSQHVALSPDRRTATRQMPMFCFDQGIAFSDQSLNDNEIFEIRIDEMMPFPMWKGSVEIGITSLNPMAINLPKTMTDLTTGTWMLSGNQVVINGKIIRRGYCQNLNSLSVGDRLGVCRADNGTLHFFINGKHQGAAASGIPQGVHAVVDIYGKCTKVSIFYPGGPPSNPSRPHTALTAPPVAAPTSNDVELQRYYKQRRWIQECRTQPFSLWLMSHLMSSSTDDDKRELFLFINSFGHRLNQSTATCDGCNTKIAIRSTRYRCMECEDLDLCVNCFSSKRTPKDHHSGHKLAEMRWCCDGKDCGGHITGARFHCLVCEDFDLCYGCQKTKNWPPRHKDSHSMTKSSTLIGNQQSGAAATAVGGGSSKFCPPGQHQFSLGTCVICTNCGECTGYGVNCINNKQTNRDPKGLCGCGLGDAGCTKCGICKKCENKIKAGPGIASPTVTSRPISAPRKKCEYREMCERFVKSLNISDEFFDKTPAFNKCFCVDCHKARGDKECYSRGKPAQTYALPIGWSRFSIKVGPHAKVLKIFEEWHVAFHGTQSKYLKPIFHNGAQLLMAGDVAYGGSELHEGEGHYNENWKPKGFDTKKIFVSPSIKYSGCPVYAKKQSFVDPVTKKTVSVQVAMQVLIRPGSYDIGKTTVERAQPFDANFSDDELEWSTKERGAVIVTGLLVKIQ
ncbi:neuralized-like protein 4 [Dendronephthya gigantea]|uniref:neuralized-like protein 4 n=1 Tax=Dendronephthya gigantea TaxID=151771 RepID=UPI00106BD8DE|nr:neuralized-like protein 4 [Dendronephthya gigantea]